MTEYQAKVRVVGKQGAYRASVVPVPETGTQPPPPWELHFNDSITLGLDWQGEPADASLSFMDVNITHPGPGEGPFCDHSVVGLKSSNGKNHDPSQSWGQSPGPGWWSGGNATKVSRQKGAEWVEVYEIHGVQGQEHTCAVIRDIEVLDPKAEDCYYFSGRVVVKAPDGRVLSTPGLHVPFDPEMVNKGGGGRR